jgi:general secretion pathway protein M
MKDWFLQLNQREQLSLLSLGLAVTLYALFMFIWSPLDSRREQLTVQNSAVADSLVRVDAMVSEVIQLRKSGVKTGAKRSLTTIINESTGRLKLPVIRLQPNSRGEIQVRIENAAFDNVLQWLHEMEYTQGLLVREVSVVQAGTVGRVNVTVRVAEAG